MFKYLFLKDCMALNKGVLYMKISKSLVVVLFLIILFAIIVTSQISPATTINVEALQTCTTNFYDEVQNIYGNCIYYSNYTSCLNSSGPNTDCSLQQAQINFTCKTGEVTTTKNTTACNPLNKFIVSINTSSTTEKKEIDFSSWGVCINSTENGCLAITCGTLKGGSARNGIFNGCDGGKSCQRFLFCQDGIKVLYKASRNDFVEYDPTFHLSPLALKEVGQ